MTDMNSYTMTVRVENFVPPDVLVEHLAVALQSLHFTGKVDIQMSGYEAPNKITPFSNPSNVLFDDEPQSEEYTGPQPEKPKYATGGYTGTGGGKYQPAGIVHSGEWHLPHGRVENRPHLHLDLDQRPSLPADPYPFITRFMDAIRARRAENRD